MLTFLVIAFVFAGLGLKVWRDKVATETNNGILLDSKSNMKEFIIAILKDNENNERMNGFTDEDIIEIYENSIEIMSFNDEVSSLFDCLTLFNLACKEDHLRTDRHENAL